jgi:hypothetical protein
MDSGTGITGGGSEYAALLAHAGGALYGMELGSVTLKRIGFFCFPIKHSTHTGSTGPGPEGHGDRTGTGPGLPQAQAAAIYPSL